MAIVSVRVPEVVEVSWLTEILDAQALGLRLMIYREPGNGRVDLSLFAQSPLDQLEDILLADVIEQPDLASAMKALAEDFRIRS